MLFLLIYRYNKCPGGNPKNRGKKIQKIMVNGLNTPSLYKIYLVFQTTVLC